MKNDQLMVLMFYLVKRTMVACNMLVKSLVSKKLNFLNFLNYRRMKKPRKIDDFLYRHFKQTNHSPSSLAVCQAHRGLPVGFLLLR